MPRFVSRFIARELRNARRRWVQGFRTGRAWLAVPITAASMYVLWNWAFGLGSYFGTSFAIAQIPHLTSLGRHLCAYGRVRVFDSGVGRALAGVLAGIGSGPTPYIAVLRPKKAWLSLGDLAESPSIDGPGKATYARYGSADRASIL